jgi:hypothetical protein
MPWIGALGVHPMLLVGKPPHGRAEDSVVLTPPRTAKNMEGIYAGPFAAQRTRAPDEPLIDLMPDVLSGDKPGNLLNEP